MHGVAEDLVAVFLNSDWWYRFITHNILYNWKCHDHFEDTKHLAHLLKLFLAPHVHLVLHMVFAMFVWDIAIILYRLQMHASILHSMLL